MRRHHRYFSALPCEDPARTCLFFKDEVNEEWVAGVSSADGLLFKEDPTLAMPKIAVGIEGGDARSRRTGGGRGELERRRAALTHNAAVLRLNATDWMMVGGKHNTGKDKMTPGKPKRGDPLATGLMEARRVGVWMVRGRTWRFDAAAAPARSAASAAGGAATAGAPAWLDAVGKVLEPRRSNWGGKRLLFDGTHPGCVERRTADISPNLIGDSTCEFDGRLGLVHFRGRLLLCPRRALTLRASGAPC